MASGELLLCDHLRPTGEERGRVDRASRGGREQGARESNVRAKGVRKDMRGTTLSYHLQGAQQSVGSRRQAHKRKDSQTGSEATTSQPGSPNRHRSTPRCVNRQATPLSSSSQLS